MYLDAATSTASRCIKGLERSSTHRSIHRKHASLLFTLSPVEGMTNKESTGAGHVAAYHGSSHGSYRVHVVDARGPSPQQRGRDSLQFCSRTLVIAHHRVGCGAEEIGGVDFSTEGGFRS